MQSVLRKVEGQTGSGQGYQVETPSIKKSPPEGKSVASFCEHCETATRKDLASSYKVFEDINGNCWRCFRPMTCDHAIIIFGKMHSCRVRTAAIYEEMRS